MTWQGWLKWMAGYDSMGIGSSGRSAPSVGRKIGGSESTSSRGRTSASTPPAGPRGGMGRMSGEAKRRGRLRARSAPSHLPSLSENKPWPTLPDVPLTLNVGESWKDWGTYMAESSSPSPTVTTGKHGRTCPKCNPSIKTRMVRRIRCLWLSILRAETWCWWRVFSMLLHCIRWDIPLLASVAHTLRPRVRGYYAASTRQRLQYAWTLVREGTLSSFTDRFGRFSTVTSVSSCACHTKTEG